MKHIEYQLHMVILDVLSSNMHHLTIHVAYISFLGVSTMAFNLNGLNFNESSMDSTGHLINSWADIVNPLDE
jgi:hypothetical protein